MTPNKRAMLASKYQSDGMAMTSPQKLVVLMFERIQTDLDAATAAITGRNVEGAHVSLLNAQDLVFELQMALDDEVWEGAGDLRSLYDYVLDALIEANVDKSLDAIDRCRKIIEPLAESWTEAYQQLQRELATAAR